MNITIPDTLPGLTGEWATNAVNALSEDIVDELKLHGKAIAHAAAAIRGPAGRGGGVQGDPEIDPRAGCDRDVAFDAAPAAGDEMTWTH